MKNLIFALICLCLTQGAFAADNATQAVEKRVEALRLAMVNADAKQLKALTSSELTYGHSGGEMQNQAEFIEKIVSGRSDFVTMELNQQTVSVHGDVALVRHYLDATTNDRGVPGKIHLGVLLVWKKQHGQWELLARQAFKPH